MPYKRDGKWRGMVMVQGQRQTATFDTRREARTWEEGQRKELRRGSTTPTISLLEAYTEYLEEVQARHVKATFLEKQYLGRRMMAAWGTETGVAAVNPEMVQKLLMTRLKDASANAANKDRKNLQAFFRWLELKGIYHNPVLHIRKYPHQRAAQRIPNHGEVLRLLAVAQGQDKVMLIAYLNTAARKSEILRWQWNEDINFEKRMVRLGTRKTRDGEMKHEWLPMNDLLHDELWGHYQKRLRDVPWVFPNPDRRSLRHGERYTFRGKWMKALCKRAGINPPFGLHAIRRYVASVLADTHKKGAKSIQRVLRHQALTTTERYIGNVNQDLVETMALLANKIEKERETCLNQDDCN